MPVVGGIRKLGPTRTMDTTSMAVDSGELADVTLKDQTAETTDQQLIEAPLVVYSGPDSAVVAADGSELSGTRIDPPLVQATSLAHGDSESQEVKRSCLSGAKRNAEEMSAETTNKDEAKSTSKGQESHKSWVCSICQVSTTSELGLHDHIQGKKHKAKVAKLSSSSVDDNNSCACSSAVLGSSNDSPQPISSLKGDSYLGEKPGKGNQATKSNERKHAYWCEICKVGTNSEPQMYIHQKGKKHLSMVGKVNQSLEHREVIANMKQEQVEGQCSEKEESHRKKDSVLAKVNKVEEIKVGLFLQEGLRQETIKRFFCQMCEVETNNKEDMDKHRKGEEHMALLKQKRGNVIVVSNIYAELVDEEGAAK